MNRNVAGKEGRRRAPREGTVDNGYPGSGRRKSVQQRACALPNRVKNERKVMYTKHKLERTLRSHWP